MEIPNQLSSFIEQQGITEEAAEILKAQQRSQTLIDHLRQTMREKAEDAGLQSGWADVVAFGSLARQEFTEQSDLDFLVVVTALPASHSAPHDLVRIARSLTEGEGSPRGPGSSGLFGESVAAYELFGKVGLQEDTNHSHTRRLLYLEESVSLFDQDNHKAMLRLILERYLRNSLGEFAKDGSHVTSRPPRFLINDVVRYWRTVAVDYQAKVDARQDAPEWGLRYLKLIFTRKVTFASTAAVLLTCGKNDWVATADSLAQRLEAPPLQRLVEIAPVLSEDGVEHLKSLLVEHSWFLGQLSSAEWRADVNLVTDRANRNKNENFMEARSRARDLHMALSGVLMDEALRTNTESYLVF